LGADTNEWAGFPQGVFALVHLWGFDVVLIGGCGGVQVRMSGQDSERGTFNQRHHNLYDQTTGCK